MVAIGYTRVSTDQQAEQGVSLDAQAEKIRAMAVAKDVELLDIIVDAGKSAGTLNRPGLDRLLGLVDRRKIQAVIVTSHDRLSRKLLDQLHLLDRFKRSGVSVISVTESWDTSTAAGQLQTNIMGSVAQHYRDYVSERTRAALAHKKANGQRVGTIPFGSALAADGKTLISNPDEQEIITLIQECRAAGYSLQAIADELNRQGHRTRRGSSWRHPYIDNILAATQPVVHASGCYV